MPEPVATTSPFDEKRLRADIASVWGEHGAHIDVFDFMLAEIEALRSLIRGAVEIEVLDELGWRGRGVSMSLLPGEWSGVIARAVDHGSSQAHDATT